VYNQKIGTFSFRLWGRYALFTDPITKIGGEKSTYHIPTYEALKGVAKSIYWKPTIVWHVEQLRVLNRIQTESKGTKLRPYQKSSADLAWYTFLHDVNYQVQVSFWWNLQHESLEADRNAGKHLAMIKRSLDRGGRQDIFLGARDCQGYVEPCVFGEGEGEYDATGEVAYGVMFHSFGYPDETGEDSLLTRLWRPKMVDGVIQFPVTDDDCLIVRRVRPAKAKSFGLGSNVQLVDELEADFGGVA
jgi:CRISPR-associated protein Cas5d